jgi:hypothetical protein
VNFERCDDPLAAIAHCPVCNTQMCEHGYELSLEHTLELNHPEHPGSAVYVHRPSKIHSHELGATTPDATPEVDE